MSSEENVEGRLRVTRQGHTVVVCLSTDSLEVKVPLTAEQSLRFATELLARARDAKSVELMR